MTPTKFMRSGTNTERRFAVLPEAGGNPTMVNGNVWPANLLSPPMVKDEVGAGRVNIVLDWFEELKRAAPTSARLSFRRREIDTGWWPIAMAQKLRWLSVRHEEPRVARARLPEPA